MSQGKTSKLPILANVRGPTTKSDCDFQQHSTIHISISISREQIHTHNDLINLSIPTLWVDNSFKVPMADKK